MIYGIINFGLLFRVLEQLVCVTCFSECNTFGWLFRNRGKGKERKEKTILGFGKKMKWSKQNLFLSV